MFALLPHDQPTQILIQGAKDPDTGSEINQWTHLFCLLIIHVRK